MSRQEHSSERQPLLAWDMVEQGGDWQFCKEESEDQLLHELATG